MKRISILLVVVALALGACSGGASTCEELADEAIDLVQALIDDVEAELGDADLAELAESAADLPSLEEYEEKANDLDAQADDLGCSEAEMSGLVTERGDQLKATTPVGNLIIEGITSGGL